MKSKYAGMLMTTLIMDGEKSILLLALSIVPAWGR